MPYGSCLICFIQTGIIPFRYFYRLLSGPEPLSTFEKDRAWHVPEELDVLAMQVGLPVFKTHYLCLNTYPQYLTLSRKFHIV